MHTEIETIAAFHEFLQVERNETFAFQGLDLREYEAQLCALPIKNSFFLGCQLTDASIAKLSKDDNTIFPHVPHLPFQPFRGTLYTAEELLMGYERGNHASFSQKSIDAHIYRYFQRTHRSHVVSTLLERIHDHAIDDALEHILSQKERMLRAVGIMGGHSCKRNTDDFRQIAHLGYKLTKAGYFVVTGGGPGAMEAGNLGAYMSIHTPEELDEALDMLSVADGYDHPLWFDTALAVQEKWPSDAESLGVPTWFYGHEPSNLFASFIAKYFANSIREDGILSICHAGIIYTPGSAGTIQEIFQDACQNHYGSCAHISPMVFWNTTYWTQTKPVYPLLQKLSEGREYHEMLGIYDSLDDIITHLQENPFRTSSRH